MAHPDFSRRLKTNRAVDSTCLHCMQNIGSSFSETSLNQLESSHWCWQRQAKLMRQRNRAARGGEGVKYINPLPNIECFREVWSEAEV